MPSNTRQPRVGDACFTEREFKIFVGLALGVLRKRIAADLGISYMAVACARRRVLRRLGLRRDAELTALALHHGVVRFEP